VKKQQIVALVIIVVVALWMFVPRDADTRGDQTAGTVAVIVAVPEGQSNSENPEILTVRAAKIGPQIYTKQVRVRGRTQASRHVQVRAEEAGRIVGDPVKRGARVQQGDVLCEIAVDNRQVNLQEATARREQAQFEYNASLDLQQRGLQSDVAVAQLKAALESSKAAVSRAELSLSKTKILAPFAGQVETRTVEIGDLLNAGTVCASVLDDSPMLLVGLVPEQDIASISVGARVTAKLLNDEVITGAVSYLSRAADAASRSYRIEVEVDVRFDDLREGITAELMVDASEILAHLIPSSAITLDDNGAIGVKLIGPDNIIQFSNIEIVGDNTSQLNPGIWVTGLNGNVNLVTLGQEIVFPGQRIESNYDWSE
jgi:membrane fusion protein, multidrug efflux system